MQNPSGVVNREKTAENVFAFPTHLTSIAHKIGALYNYAYYKIILCFLMIYKRIVLCQIMGETKVSGIRLTFAPQ